MPVRWYRSPDDAERDLQPSPDAETGMRTALALARFDEATRRGIRITVPGVQRFATVAEGEANRERVALARLRAADAGRGNLGST
jgi:hypothetical protein